MFFIATLVWSQSQKAHQENQWEGALEKATAILNGSGAEKINQFAECLSELPPNPTEVQAQTVAELFNQSLNLASPANHAKLINNYGIFLLKQQQYGQAATLFGDLDPEALRSLGSPERARFHYNHARALQLEGQSNQAAAIFAKAIDADEAFSTAYQRLFDLALASKESALWRSAISAANRLLANGRHSQTLNFALATLALPPDHMKQAMLADFMPFVMDYFHAAHVNPQHYGQDWHPKMKQAWEALDWPLANWDPAQVPKVRTHELAKAYSHCRVVDAVYMGAFKKPDRFRDQIRAVGSLPLNLNHARWSELFESAGKDFLKTKNYLEAANLFILAWEFSPFDTEAGLYLSNTLLAGGAGVDPEGKIFDYLIQNSYQGKGQAYKMDNPVLIYRFHVLLGTIFSDRKTWDSERRFYGARKQWSMAADWFEQLKRNPPPNMEHEFTLAPGLYANLGLANQNSAGYDGEAWKAYTTATEHFIEQNNKTAARKVYNQRETLPTTMRSAENQDRNQKLIQKLFLPANGDKRTAAALARHVTWLASGKTKGKQANFKRLDLREYDFSGLDLTGTDFTGADLRGAKFTGTNLSQVNFSKANLDGATFLKANLENANLKKAKLNNAYLERSSLKKEQLSPKQLKALNQKSLRNFSP